MPSIFVMGVCESNVVRAVREMLEAHKAETGDTYEDIVIGLQIKGLTATVLSGMLNGHVRLNLEVLIGLTRLLKRLDGVQSICAAVMCLAVATPRETTIHTLHAADAMVALEESTQAAGAIIRGIHDGTLTEGERDDAVREIDEAMTYWLEVRRLVLETRTAGSTLREKKQRANLASLKKRRVR